MLPRDSFFVSSGDNLIDRCYLEYSAGVVYIV